MSLSSLLLPPPTRSATKDSQCRTTTSTTILKMVGNNGSISVTPIPPRKGYMYYPPTRATILRRSQYLRRRRRALGPTPYPSSIPRHMDISKASYALCRYRNISWSTPSLKAETFYISLTLKVVVPVPQTTHNLCMESW